PVATDFSDFKNDSDLADYIYVSQVMKRDGISRAIQDHRRAEPYCMGTLFWQYNDCWPVTSWSSTDYYGQPKLLQYALKDLYAPVLVSVAERNDSVLLYVVNDDTIRHVGILGFQWFSFDGVNARTSIARTTVYAGRSMMVLGFPKNMLFDELKPEQGVMNVVFSYEGDKSVSTKYYFAKTKSLDLPKDPGIVTDVVPVVGKPGAFTLTLRTVSLAKNVYMSIDDAGTKFSDNGFDLMAGETKDIVITTSLSLDELKTRLKLQTMNDFR
ncbi:MAG TPA: glycoside hydrolase family 2 protein, partial [Bacteroidia bacterium]|nr:glycoside hydrolase family 2 protein [Bacteroidia bacterium]